MTKLKLTPPSQQLYIPPNLVHCNYKLPGGLVFTIAKTNDQFGIPQNECAMVGS
jgi:hypothetical protein